MSAKTGWWRKSLNLSIPSCCLISSFSRPFTHDSAAGRPVPLRTGSEHVKFTTSCRQVEKGMYVSRRGFSFCRPFCKHGLFMYVSLRGMSKPFLRNIYPVPCNDRRYLIWVLPSNRSNSEFIRNPLRGVFLYRGRCCVHYTGMTCSGSHNAVDVTRKPNEQKLYWSKIRTISWNLMRFLPILFERGFNFIYQTSSKGMQVVIDRKLWEGCYFRRVLMLHKPSPNSPCLVLFKGGLQPLVLFCVNARGGKRAP